jgi:hypothetical protein
MRRFVLIITLLVSLSVAALPAAADPPAEEEPACSADPLVAMDDGCTDATVAPEAAAVLAQAQVAPPALADDVPRGAVCTPRPSSGPPLTGRSSLVRLRTTLRLVPTTTSRSRRSPRTTRSSAARRTTSSARSGHTSTPSRR